MFLNSDTLQIPLETVIKCAVAYIKKTVQCSKQNRNAQDLRLYPSLLGQENHLTSLGINLSIVHWQQ